MNKNIEKVLAVLDGFRMSDEMTYSAYSVLNDEISLLDDLLKAQEPRLLNADDFVEADGWGSIPAWYEHNPSLGIKTIDGWGIIKRENLQDKTTRYWTSRPTAEQRRAVKWE